MEDMLAYMSKNADVWMGWQWWSAGPWWGELYVFFGAGEWGGEGGLHAYFEEVCVRGMVVQRSLVLWGVVLDSLKQGSFR